MKQKVSDNFSNDNQLLVVKWVIAGLFVLLVGLQYRLWVGEGSYAELSSLNKKLLEQKQINRGLKLQNEQLSTRVDALKNGLEEIESRAREELGLIKPGETFYWVIEEQALTTASLDN